MLDLIRRCFRRRPAFAGERALGGWAQSRGHLFKRLRDGEGFIVEAADGAWRLEGGASRRCYIEGAELRLHARLGTGAELQLLLLSRALMETLEKQVFEAFTEGLQTRIDTATPDEMRWLVLHPRPPALVLGRLREQFGAAGNHEQALADWVQALAAQWPGRFQAADFEPLVLMVQRARLSLRTSLNEFDEAQLDALLQLFLLAHRETARVAAQWGRGTVNSADSTGIGPRSIVESETRSPR